MTTLDRPVAWRTLRKALYLGLVLWLPAGAAVTIAEARHGLLIALERSGLTALPIIPFIAAVEYFRQRREQAENVSKKRSTKAKRR